MLQQSILERVLSDYSTVKLDRNSSYHISYPDFLQYFEKYEQLDKHTLTIGIHFTYGWMPTAFDFRVGDIDSVVKILNCVRKAGVIERAEVETCKDLLNGSLVGTSKLLHFLSPATFPIWDSRVYRYFFKKEPHFYRMDDVNSYMEYCRICRSLAAQLDFDPVHTHVTSQLYPVSRIRSLELIMFDKGGKSKLKNGT